MCHMQQKLRRYHGKFLMSHRGLLGLLILLAILVLTGCARSGEASGGTEDIDLSTPEAAVLNLYRAFNSNDIQLFRAVIDLEDESNRKALQAFKQQVTSEVSYETTNIEMDIVENDGHIARVRIHFYQRILVDGQVVAEGESGAIHTLVYKRGNWYQIGLGQWPPPGWVKELP